MDFIPYLVLLDYFFSEVFESGLNPQIHALNPIHQGSIAFDISLGIKIPSENISKIRHINGTFVAS
jgi:hypothetical protein